MKRIFDLINWQRIKYQNRKKLQKKIFEDWVSDGKKIPPPHIVKQKTIEYFQNKYSVKILVETGTFRGEMIYAQRNNFDKIFSIELSEELFNTAKKRFGNYKNIELIFGDSGKMIKNIIDKISQPAIFWLDGHYSGFETAKGDLETPVYSELESIINSKINHFVLIDDARLFVGKNDYPSIEELKNYVLSKKNNYIFENKDDIIRVYPNNL